MSVSIKLSSPGTGEFWEIAILHEDEHLLALDKPSGLLTSPDRYDPDRPNLVKLLHAGIAAGKPWAKAHGFTYLTNAHRLDSETSGVVLLGRSKPVLVKLASLFGSDKTVRHHLALVQGLPREDCFEVNARLAPHPGRPGVLRADPQHGKRCRTRFEVLERFSGCALLRCEPHTGSSQQIRAHLRHVGLPLLGDRLYGGRPLLLSRLKRGYRQKQDRPELPLVGRAALHAERLTFPHPVGDETITIAAPWPKDFQVALKYLRRYASGTSAVSPESGD